jgi:predicted metal-dependent peptidase
MVRILWWDTKVHGQQIFKDNYANIGSMLKPQGGGGTKVSSVSDYINKEKLKAECVIVFTDGYLESDVKWEISSPTLWMITENKDWDVPSGKKVIFNK